MSEITDPKYRGFFLASITFNISLGIFMTHFLAFFCTWDVNAIICAAFPFIGYITATFFSPETPSWLLSKNHTQKACDTFLWLRGCDEIANNEFRTMVDAQGEMSQNDTHQNNDDNDKRNDTNSIVRLAKQITHKSFYVPLVILTIYFATLQFSGKNNIHECVAS